MYRHLLILHYHFRKGGVTDVVRHAQKILETHTPPLFSRITLACGENFSFLDATIPDASTHLTLNTEIIPSLGYRSEESSYSSKDIRVFFEKHTRSDTLWWVHNYHLGKNPFFTRDLLAHLRKTHQPCILHIHDFPEDARFANMELLGRTLPLSTIYDIPHPTTFAVINRSDMHALQKAGIKAHLIPNIVSFPSDHARFPLQRSQTRSIKQALCQRYASFRRSDLDYTLFTYPVRCIRRKNVLEAALLCKLFQYKTKQPSKLAVTLPGTSDQERAYSTTVKTLFARHYIEGFFGVGTDEYFPFLDACAASDVILSTSVQEGFGFTYIGAASWGTPLLARSVRVQSDNEKALGSWPSLWYKNLQVPRALLNDRERCDIFLSYKKKIEAIARQCASMKFLPQKESPTDIVRALESELASFQKKESFDFSMLSVECQVRLIVDCENGAERLCEENSSLLENIRRLTEAKHRIHADDIAAVRQNVSRLFSPSSFLSSFTCAMQSTRPKKTRHSHNIAVSQRLLHAHAKLGSLRPLFSPLSVPLLQ